MFFSSPPEELVSAKSLAITRDFDKVEKGALSTEYSSDLVLGTRDS